jgi:WD40 repeat protein
MVLVLMLSASIRDVLEGLGRASLWPCLVGTTCAAIPPLNARPLLDHDRHRDFHHDHDVRVLGAVQPGGREVLAFHRVGAGNLVGDLDVAKVEELANLPGHTGAIVTVAMAPHGRILATGSYDRTVKLWEVPTGKELGTLKGHGNIIRAVTYSHDGRTIASGCYDQTVKIWDVAGQKELLTLETHAGGPPCHPGLRLSKPRRH